MKPLTAEWVSKAEGDYVCVSREWRARKSPNHDALCFHAQQRLVKVAPQRFCHHDRVGFRHLVERLLMRRSGQRTGPTSILSPGW